MVPITVIYGPMFGGKSKTLIDHIRACSARCLIFKHAQDRRTTGTISSHDPYLNDKVEAICVGSFWQILEHLTDDVEHIFIDEVQFFDPAATVKAIQVMREKHPNVGMTVAGLDTTFRGEPWQVMTSLIGMADNKIQCLATCARCGCRASRSFRKGEGTETVEVGGAEKYEPRCVPCHVRGMEG